MGTCQSRAADSFAVAASDGTEAHVDRGTVKMKSDMASLVSPSEKTTVTFPETPSYGSLLHEGNSKFVSPLPKPPLKSSNGSGTSVTQASEQGDYNSGSFISQGSHGMNHSMMDSLASGGGGVAKGPEIDSRRKKNGIGTPRRLRLGKAKLEKEHGGQNTPTCLIPKRMIMQDNAVYRPAPLIAPSKNSISDTTATAVGHGNKPKTSVTPQIIANFNRLKIQVQLAEQKAINRRRKAKLEDRFEDVKAYRDLWRDYENLKKQVNNVRRSRNDELDNGKSDDRSVDLMQPTSWYFDFRSLKKHEHLAGFDDDDDNCSQASMSLLSDGTMEAQREYYKEKRRQQKNAKSTRPRQRTGPSDRSVASARSAVSRGSAPYLRGQTDTQTGDYGPIRDDDSCTVDISYIGSDDSTPRTRTGRTVGDDMSRTTFQDDAGSFVSELDMDNEYHVRRKLRPRRNVTDDSSLDTHDDKSVRGFALSSVEFDMTEFLPRVRDSTTAKNGGQGDARGEQAKPVPATSKAYEMPSYKCSLSSRIEHYGFDPSAPLSSQLAMFAQSVPSVEIDDAKTGNVRWRKFADKESSAARRLEDIFDSTHQDELQSVPQTLSKEAKPSSVAVCVDSSRHIEEIDCPETAKELKGIPTDIEIVTNSADLANEPSQGSSTSTPSYSPSDAMSPSNYLMMSSAHEHLSQQHSDDAKAIEKGSNKEGIMNHAELASIVSMPTEHFLQMSTWYSTPLGLSLDESFASNSRRHDADLEDCKDETGVAMVKVEPTCVSCPIESPLPHTSETRQDRSEGDLGRIIVSMSMPEFDEDFDDISNQVVQAVDNLLKKFRDSV